MTIALLWMLCGLTTAVIEWSSGDIASPDSPSRWALEFSVAAIFGPVVLAAMMFRALSNLQKIITAQPGN